MELQYMAMSNDRLCCDVLDILLGLEKYTCCKMECPHLHEDVAHCTVAFIQGGLRYRDRFLLVLPNANNPLRRARFVENHELIIPPWAKNAHKIVCIRPPLDGDVYRGEERESLKKDLKRLVLLEFKKKKRRRKRRSGKYEKRRREREMHIQ